MRLPISVSALTTTVLLASDAPSVLGLRGIADTMLLRPSAAALGRPTVPVPSARIPKRRTRPRVHLQSAVELDDSLVGLKSSPTEQDNLVRESFDQQPPAFTTDNTISMDMDMQELTQKLINAVFLAVGFGWAAYTIFNIDSGMTRGWSQGEIAMRIPLDNWGNYEASLAEKPIFTKTLINVIIYLLGDWLSQTIFAKKNVLDFDIARTLRNGFIGLCFGPLVHEYYAFSDTILPVEGGIMNRVQKILMDQTLYLTVKCSIYIVAVGLLSGDDFDTCKQTVKDKIGSIVITAWKFWPLIHCVTYGFIPARHRILWVNCVDLVWNAILATKAQKDEPEDNVLEEMDAFETSIMESAEAFLHGSNSTDTLAVVVEHTDSLAEVKDAAEHHPTGSDDTVQDVRITGMSIENGMLIGMDDEETRLPLATPANASSDESYKIPP